MVIRHYLGQLGIIRIIRLIFSVSNFIIRRLVDLKDVLMDPECSGPEEVYYVVQIPETEYGPEPNITIVPPGRLGREFSKTHGHHHRHGESETYRVLYGEAHLLIQKTDDQGRVVDIRSLQASTGEKMEVPQGYAHCLINATDDVLVTADWESSEAGHEYESIKEKRGFGYYLVDDDGKVKVVKNPEYNEVPELIGFNDK